MRLLVTAGPTREYIDAVRFLSNPSSGRMGYAVAQAALDAGFEVSLISGPVSLSPPAGAEFVPVQSAAQMLQAAQARFADCRAAVFAAAVCDHAPAERHDAKLHKSDFPTELRLVETADIAATLCRAKGSRVAVGFALETDDAEASALRKLKHKHLDYIVANSPSSFGSDRASAVILGPGAARIVCDDMPKVEIARALVELLREALERQSQG